MRYVLVKGERSREFTIDEDQQALKDAIGKL